MSIEDLAVYAIAVSSGREGRERAVHELAQRAREAEHRIVQLERCITEHHALGAMDGVKLGDSCPVCARWKV